jgi:hypothetical protein
LAPVMIALLDGVRRRGAPAFTTDGTKHYAK